MSSAAKPAHHPLSWQRLVAPAPTSPSVDLRSLGARWGSSRRLLRAGFTTPAVTFETLDEVGRWGCDPDGRIGGLLSPFVNRSEAGLRSHLHGLTACLSLVSVDAPMKLWPFLCGNPIDDLAPCAFALLSEPSPLPSRKRWRDWRSQRRTRMTARPAPASHARTPVRCCAACKRG